VDTHEQREQNRKTLARITPMETMKILCDHMLGSLATWLRVLGVDTFYPDNQMSDHQILQIAADEQRLIVSRDKQLIAQAKKRMIPVLELASTTLNEQLETLVQKIQLEPEKALTRCTVCNTPLTTVQKADVAGHVPPKVFESHQQFWFCPHCTKYYWMGTHYHNMMNTINELTSKKKP
jgi:uncharacterized protein with PIN domain